MVSKIKDLNVEATLNRYLDNTKEQGLLFFFYPLNQYYHPPGKNTLAHGVNSSQQSFIVVDTAFHLEKIWKMVICLMLPNTL